MTRYAPAALTGFAAALFEAGGMEPAKAATVAEVLVEGDLMGHDTHGLALLPPYLDGLASGDMLGQGEPEVLSGTPAVMPDPFSEEPRMRAIGKTATGRYVFLVFMLRKIDGQTRLRPISARYMHQKEIAHYERPS